MRSEPITEEMKPEKEINRVQMAVLVFLLVLAAVLIANLRHGFYIPALSIAVPLSVYRGALSGFTALWAAAIPLWGRGRSAVLSVMTAMLPLILTAYLECVLRTQNAVPLILAGLIAAALLTSGGVWTAAGKRRKRQEPAWIAQAVRLLPVCLLAALYTGTLCWMGHVMYSEHRQDTALNLMAPDAEASTAPRITDDTWNGLDVPDRLELLTDIVAEECRSLGIDSVPLEGDILPGEVPARCATNRRGESLIAVDLRFLEGCNADEAVFAVCHEVRHAFQSRTAALLDWDDPAVEKNLYFRELLAWRKELTNYENGLEAESYSAYSQQALETDANAYARERTGYYIFC